MSDSNDNRGTAAVLAEEFAKLHGIDVRSIHRPGSTTETPEDALIAILPNSKKVIDLAPFLDAQRDKPRRRTGTARAYDLASFIAHFKRFAGEESVIFANPSDRAKPTFTAVFDYHPKGDKAMDADWLQHRLAYAPDLSEEWTAWSVENGEGMLQAEFAAFLEDRITDVVVADASEKRIAEFARLVQGRWADPTDLLALSRGLSVNVSTAVKNAVTLNTGAIQVQYAETHNDGTGAPIDIANLFQIVIPVFYAGAAYRIAVRLRYRLQSGLLTWSYHMVRPDVVFDDAFTRIIEDLETAGAAVFIGAPEA